MASVQRELLKLCCLSDLIQDLKTTRYLQPNGRPFDGPGQLPGIGPMMASKPQPGRKQT
ncbi:MAG: hypothetical protein JWM11_69 [Planctomycetaceae bacterium]|nr:hypothetical protein [Planctomycetaceae bacterium]